MIASVRFLVAATTALLSLGLIAGVRFYQAVISPLIGPRCRYTPTCSLYAVLAVERYGPILGTWKSVCRIGRCHPWGGAGWDPP